MKKLILFFSFLPFISYSQIDTTKIEWSETTFDFGTIPHRVPATHEFRFKNIGKDSIRIVSVEATCGCTKPEWSLKPIAPNQTGYVRGTYKADAIGPFNKQITIYTNRSQLPTFLKLKGVVNSSEHYEGDGHKH